MKLDVYYVDAFADNVFSGNPAAVIFSDCLLYTSPSPRD